MSVENSGAAGRAVFISYASQDAEAAQRICEALRAAGAEVWFDQSELVGGDAWDAQIRKQIKACALFVPVISAATEARTEGYFRLEWRLADHRTHLMARGRPFLLPIVIDDTRESQAHVPESFTEVQWTRLRDGRGADAFGARVKAILEGEARRGGDTAFLTGSSPPAEIPLKPAANRSRRFASMAGAVAILALVLWQPWRTGSKPPTSGGAAPARPKTFAEELEQVRVRMTPSHWQKGDFDAVSATLDRLIQANPESSDAWALRSIINSLQTVRQYDRATKPLEVGKNAAERALRLAPDSPLADLALGFHFVAMLSRGGDAQACRPHLDRALAKLPPDGLTRFIELCSYYHGYDFAGTERCARAWLAVEPTATFPAWILSLTCLARRQPDEAEKWSDASVTDPSITGIRANVTQFEVAYYLRADLNKARAELETIPLGGRSVHRVVHARWLMSMAEKRWDDALQLLAQLPEPFLSDRTFHGPRALLGGQAHRAAGRIEPAAAQFREAERLLREYLATDADNEGLHAALALTLACAGRDTDARNELALVEPLIAGRPPSLYRGPLVVLIAQTYRELKDVPAMVPWIRKLFAEPSDVSFTPASLRLDARFSDLVDAPAMRPVMAEFASLDAGNVRGTPLGVKPK